MSEPDKTTSETKEFLSFLAKLLIFVFILRSFIVAPFNIPSESMQPRLLVGDYLLVSKWSYGYSKYSMPFSLPLIPGRIMPDQPERGDVVVFKAPPSDEQDYIKRVIGLPGDIVQMKGGILFLNGTAVKREKIADFTHSRSPNSPCFVDEGNTQIGGFERQNGAGEAICAYPQYVETLPNGKSYRILDVIQNGVGDTTRAFVVPDAHMFVMGDNRDRSADSRFPAMEGKAVGIVPQENLVGQAFVSVFSTDGSSSWLKPWTWFSAARWERIGESF